MGLGEPGKSEPPGGILGAISYMSWGQGHRQMDGEDTTEAEGPLRKVSLDWSPEVTTIHGAPWEGERPGGGLGGACK